MSAIAENTFLTALNLAKAKQKKTNINVDSMIEERKKKTEIESSRPIKAATHETDEEDFTKPWKKNGQGIYADIKSGIALFCSRDMYDSECGWPNFTATIKDRLSQLKELAGNATAPETIIEDDDSEGMNRKEILLKAKDKEGKEIRIHIGHVFDVTKDEPKSDTGERVCCNFKKLKFIPLEKMEEEGYGEYLILFADILANDNMKTSAKASI